MATTLLPTSVHRHHTSFRGILRALVVERRGTCFARFVLTLRARIHENWIREASCPRAVMRGTDSPGRELVVPSHPVVSSALRHARMGASIYFAPRRSALGCAAWCVLTNGLTVRASSNQRVQVPRGQESDRPLAGPRRSERSPWPKRGVKSLFGGSKSAGRNIK